MSVNNFNNFNTPSLNGLVDITADSITTESLIIDGIDAFEQIATNTENIELNAQNIAINAQKLTKISYDSPTDTTVIDSKLQADEIYIRDETYPDEQYMKMYYNRAGLNGFLFELMAPHQIMYFMVRDQYNNRKALQFSYTQMYTNLKFVMENTLVINGGANKLQFMDNDLASIWLVPLDQPWDGLRFTVSHPGYAINHYNQDMSNNSINTFRTQYNKITSLIQHQFDSNIIVNGVSLTPTMVSYLNNCTSNIQSQLNGKLSLGGGSISGILTTNGLVVNFDSTLKGNVILADTTSLSQAELKCLDGIVSNIQTQLNGKLSTAGGSISGILTTNGFICNFDATIGGNIILADTTSLSQAELKCLDGITSNIQTQLNSKLNLAGGTISGILTTNALVVNFDSTLKGNVILNDGTILSQAELKCLDGITSNIQTQLNSKMDNSITTLTLNTITINNDSTLKGNIILADTTSLSQAELKCLDGVTSNIQTQINSKMNASVTALSLTTLTVSGVSTLYGLDVNATATFNYDCDMMAITTFYNNINVRNNLILADSTSLSQAELKCIDGVTSNIQTQIDSKLNLSGGTLTGALTQSSGTASSNKITQNIISGDISGQANTLKYTQIRANHGFTGGTLQPVLQVIDNNNSNAINFYPNLQASAYNNINSTANTKSIIAQGTADNSIFTITNHSTQQVGIKMTTLSSSTAKTEIFGGNNKITVDSASANGITLTAGTASIQMNNGTTALNNVRQINLINANLGDIYNATLTTTVLTSGVEENVGWFTLGGGVYHISWNVMFSVINANTTVYNCTAGYSTNYSVFSDPTTVTKYVNGYSVLNGSYFSLSGSTVINLSVSTIVYLRVMSVFGTANNVRFYEPNNSSLRAARIG